MISSSVFSFLFRDSADSAYFLIRLGNDLAPLPRPPPSSPQIPLIKAGVVNQEFIFGNVGGGVGGEGYEHLELSVQYKTCSCPSESGFHQILNPFPICPENSHWRHLWIHGLQF